METMAIEKGINPADVPLTSLMSYVQTYPALQEQAQDGQDDADSDTWWMED